MQVVDFEPESMSDDGEHEAVKLDGKKRNRKAAHVARVRRSFLDTEASDGLPRHAYPSEEDLEGDEEYSEEEGSEHEDFDEENLGDVAALVLAILLKGYAVRGIKDAKAWAGDECHEKIQTTDSVENQAFCKLKMMRAEELTKHFSTKRSLASFVRGLPDLSHECYYYGRVRSVGGVLTEMHNRQSGARPPFVLKRAARAFAAGECYIKALSGWREFTTPLKSS